MRRHTPLYTVHCCDIVLWRHCMSASHRQTACTRHQSVAMRYCCTRCNLSFVTTIMKASCLLHILCILPIFKQLYRLKNPPSTPFHVQCVSCYKLLLIFRQLSLAFFALYLQFTRSCSNDHAIAVPYALLACSLLDIDDFPIVNHFAYSDYTTPSASRHRDLSGMENDCVRPSRNTDITSVLTRPPVYRGRVSHIQPLDHIRASYWDTMLVCSIVWTTCWRPHLTLEKPAVPRYRQT